MLGIKGRSLRRKPKEAVAHGCKHLLKVMVVSARMLDTDMKFARFFTRLHQEMPIASRRFGGAQKSLRFPVFPWDYALLKLWSKWTVYTIHILLAAHDKNVNLYFVLLTGGIWPDKQEKFFIREKFCQNAVWIYLSQWRMRNMKMSIKGAVWLLILLFLLGGCAGRGAQHTADLLVQDYQEMTDSELSGYYQQLSDQLARETRAARTSVGFGYGSGSFGVAAGRGLGDEEAIQALRERWNEVRSEMRRRELLP
jgi:hypothetical protein